MDSLRGIPVEYKLDAYSMLRTGPTLCYPKIGYVDLSVTPLSTHKLPIHRWSTLMEMTPTLPQVPDTKLTVTSKVQFLLLQHVFRQKWKNTIPHTSDNTRCLLKISWRHFVSTLTSLNSTSLAAPKANQIPCCNKNLFIKTPFDIRHLTSSSPSTFQFPTNLARGLTTLSEKTLQRKHTYVTTILRLPTTKTQATKMVPPR